MPLEKLHRVQLCGCGMYATSFHLSMIYYTVLLQPFFLAAGSLVLMVTSDLLFVTSQLPEKLSLLPGNFVFVVWWLILMPMMTIVFFPLVFESVLLLV